MIRGAAASSGLWLGALVSLLAALYAAHPIFSVDFHWHLKLGHVIRETAGIPRVDLFSAVDPLRGHVQFQWLWDVVASLIHDWGGARAIRAAQAALAAGSVFALFCVVRRRLASVPLTGAYVALALLLFEDRLRARPDATTLAFTVAMFPALLGPPRGGKPTAIGPTALSVLGLGVLWANVHGGASMLLPLSMGALAVGAWLSYRVAGAPKRQLVAALWWLGAACLGLTLSPTLVRGVLDWLQAVQPQIAAGNEEWQPTYTMLTRGSHPAFLIIGLAPTLVAIGYLVDQAAVLRTRGLAAVDFSQWLLAAGFLALAHHAVRNAFLCVLPVAFILQRRLSSPLSGRATLAAWACAAALLAISFDDAILEGYGSGSAALDFASYDLSPGVFPVELADFLDEAGIEGGVLNDGRWGGYLIFRVWPRCSLFADTRHHFSPEMWRVFAASSSLSTRSQAAQFAFARWGVELVAFPGPTFLLPTPPGRFRLLYKAGGQELYQHLDGAHAARNIARAAAFARSNGLALPADASEAAFAEAMTGLGRARWLRAPFQRRRLRLAEAAIAGRDATVRAHGHYRRGRLLFEAGAYDRAASDFSAALQVRASDARSRYYLALCQLHLARRDAAKTTLAELPAAPRQLARSEQLRLQALRKAL